MRLIFAILLLLLSVAFCDNVDFDAYLRNHYRGMMRTAQDAFFNDLGMAGKNLHMDREDKTILRYSRKLPYTFTFAGYPVAESVFSFTPKLELKEIAVHLYNRGDCGPWEASKFKKMVQDTRGALEKLSRDKSPRKSTRHVNDLLITELFYSGNGTDATLRWSGKGDELEYVTVTFTQHKRGDNAPGKLSEEMKADVSRKNLVRNVRKEKDGTHWLDVPMVSQGDKGYCMAATFTRIMKYYKSNVDQHIAAQLLDTDPSKGTSHRGGIDAMIKNQNLFSVTVKDVYKDQKVGSMDGIMEIVSGYNRLARKNKKPAITQEMLTTVQNEWPFRKFQEIADPKLFIASRNLQGNEAAKIMSIVKNHIDRGIPLMWFVPGHARMINGYRGNGTIIYTDSWGAGHERKEMKLKEARAITYEIYVVTPKQK